MQASLHSNLQEQLLPLVVQHLLPWTNHHTHNMRTFAQLGLCAIFEARPLDSWPAWEQGLGAGGVEMLKALQRFFDGNTDFQRFRRSVGSGMLNWVPGRAVTPAGIFCHSLSLAGGFSTHLIEVGAPWQDMASHCRILLTLSAGGTSMRFLSIGSQSLFSNYFLTIIFLL